MGLGSGMVLPMIVDPFYLTIVDLSMCQLCVMFFHLYDFVSLYFWIWKPNNRHRHGPF